MGARYPRPANRKANAEHVGELSEQVVFINRVAKVVKGGRRFSFSALVVVGDAHDMWLRPGQGERGTGCNPQGRRLGAETTAASAARGATIPFEVIGRSGSASILLKPASPGTGVIAGVWCGACSNELEFTIF